MALGTALAEALAALAACGGDVSIVCARGHVGDVCIEATYVQSC